MGVVVQAMAPLRIRCVVSFSSQDPKYPVENLLLEERAQPWLCCPLDRSRQMRAELQLEQAGCIGYIDVGNSGSAFLQIEVGRSSWPPDRDYLTLLPTTTLMVPADAKQDRNRSGVRMFKEGDLLAPALAEKWDRVRLTCSQPFNRHAQFGLAFLHIRTPEDSEERQGGPAAPSPGQASPESASKPGVFGGPLSPAGPSCGTQEERLLKRQLQQLDSALLGKTLSPSGLSRPARLVLKAAASAHKRAPLLPAGSPPPPAARSKEAGRAPRAAQSPGAPSEWAHRGSTRQQQPLENKEEIAGRLQEPSNWKEIVNKKLKFPEGLLAAIQDGQLVKIQQMLHVSDGILRQLDESEDRAWREALNLAIRTGGVEITKTLLRFVKFDFRQVHEALLVAVDTNQPSVVKQLLDRLDQEKGMKMDIKSFSMAFFDNSIDNSRFAPGVTPLTLACEKDLYEIVDMLMKKGHTISPPHKVSCACLDCSNGRKFDLLKFSLSRINTYKGIASRAYLSIASEDPMLTAFKRSRELKWLSKKEPEFKPDYLALEDLCQEFAFELLGMCRNQSEVTAVLNELGEDEMDEEDDGMDDQAFEEGIPNLARLRLAVNYNQKRFVAHPVCQQVLSSIWCGSLPSWRGSKSLWKVFVSFSIFLGMPFLSLTYFFAPKSKLGKMLKIPVIKFLLHSASYVWFLVFLLVESLILEHHQDTFQGRNQSMWETSLHMIWVTGFFWFECKEVWIEGLRSYLLDWWNFLDIVILSMYLASFVLRLLVYLKGQVFCLDIQPSTPECYYYTQAKRPDWHTEDPQFMAEVLFAVTSMLSFTRLAYILPAHETLGTLQISIGKMIDDMIRFMFIMMIILTAFLCGMNNIYVHYPSSERLGSFNKTFQFLFWTMMGMEEHNVVDMPEFFVAEMVGQVLYGIFTIVMVVVLLNMLIAMITNSFQKIENDADVEWKFARSKLYLSFFREGLTLPVPFNIIPTPKSIFYAIRGSFRFICCHKGKKSQKYPPINTISNPSVEEGGGRTETRLSYRRQVLKALVQRYIDTARRELEESRRKDLGNRLTELNKSVVRLHAEMKHLRQSVATGGVASNPLDGASVLRKYIMKVRNSFQNYEPDMGGDGQGSPVEVVVHQDIPLVMEGALPLLREEKEGQAGGQAEEAETGAGVEEEVGGEAEEEVVDMLGAEEEEEAEPVIPDYEAQEETEDQVAQPAES
ncbi:short transient receptor potential channel 2-like [Thamnophis elegans]|uniref:short transient receptor potential channel 2-like n=1 Tax=Thamnophis elegans TaxID=35005 RepID=UPI0013786B2A|nr:short transient receptor potential channel 2-like [Thamnophis elegans]